MALMVFLMKLSVVLLSMLMVLLSTLSLIGHLICGNNQNWLLNLNLIYKILWTGAGSGVLVSMLEKPNLFRLVGHISAIDLKMDGSAHEKKSSFNKPKLSFSCTLDWTLTLSLLFKLPPRIMVYFGKCLSEQAQRVTLPYSRGRSTHHSDRFHGFTVTISRSYKDAYVNSL